MRLFVIAGEPSGDMIGAAIIQGLRQLYPFLTYEGIGGPLMEEQGQFRSLVPLTALSHMGLWAIVRNFPSLRHIFYRTLGAIESSQAKGLLTIDSPEFCLRIGKRIRAIPRIHCVPPAVWAWRPKRATSVMPYATDHILSLFPFEEPYFRHMNYTFIGHPVLDTPLGDRERFWSRFGPKRPLLCLLPGSREREIRNFLPVFLETARRLKLENPDLLVAIVCPLSMRELVCAFAPDSLIFTQEQDKRDVFSAATVALAASGTVTLELAVHGTPMVIGYRVPALTGWMIKRLAHVRSVGLINIVAGEPFVPECLQENFTPEKLTHEVSLLLHDAAHRALQRIRSGQAVACLKAEYPFRMASAHSIGSILKLTPLAHT